MKASKKVDDCIGGDAIHAVRPNQVAGWAAAAVAVGVTCFASTYVTLPVPDPLPVAFWILTMGAFLEELWRRDLRPRLLWNDGGLVLIDARRIHQLVWQDVRAISVRSNRVSIRVACGRLETGFDLPWWLGAISARYRDRRRNLERALRGAQERSLTGAHVRPPETPRVRRPAALYLLFAVGVATVIAARI